MCLIQCPPFPRTTNSSCCVGEMRVAHFQKKQQQKMKLRTTTTTYALVHSYLAAQVCLWFWFPCCDATVVLLLLLLLQHSLAFAGHVVAVNMLQTQSFVFLFAHINFVFLSISSHFFQPPSHFYASLFDTDINTQILPLC